MSYCSRCERKFGFSDTKYSSKKYHFLKKFGVPEYIIICGYCYKYLDEGPYGTRLFKEYTDRDYLEYVEKKRDKVCIKNNLYDQLCINNNFYMESRYNPSCKEFDIRYGFLDEDTNLYWDEEPEEDDDEDDYEYEVDGYEDDDEDITFDKNADYIVRDKLYQKSTKAFYLSLIENMRKGYQTSFATDFQNYVTRIGLIISDVASKKISGKQNYIEILNYLCNTILDESYLFDALKTINNAGNAAKHSTDDIVIDISKCVRNFNLLIDKLVKETDIEALNMCHLVLKKNISVNICSICGKMKLKESYRCPKCKKIVCIECYDKTKKMCTDCAGDEQV